MLYRGVCRRVLKLRLVWEGSLGKAATAANRTREIRPSGMRGGLSRNVKYGGNENPSHTSKECESETLRLRLRALLFYPTIWFTRVSGWCRMTGQSGTENTGDEDGEAVAD